jgi:hypothetical protein
LPVGFRGSARFQRALPGILPGNRFRQDAENHTLEAYGPQSTKKALTTNRQRPF